MNSFFVALTVLAAVATAQAGLIAHAPLALPAPAFAHGPLLAPAPLAAAPLLHAPLHAPILHAPAVVGHAPVLLGHAPVAAATHIGAPIASQIISRPVATYATTHTLLGAPLAAPALLARPALPFAAPALPLAAPALHAPLARPLWMKLDQEEDDKKIAFTRAPPSSWHRLLATHIWLVLVVHLNEPM